MNYSVNNHRMSQGFVVVEDLVGEKCLFSTCLLFVKHIAAFVSP